MKSQRRIRSTRMLDRSGRTHPSDIDEFNHQPGRLGRKISHEADADRGRAERVGEGDILFLRIVSRCAIRWRPLSSRQFIVRLQSGRCQLWRVERHQRFSLGCVDQDLFRGSDREQDSCTKSLGRRVLPYDLFTVCLHPRNAVFLPGHRLLVGQSRRLTGRVRANDLGSKSREHLLSVGKILVEW